MNDQFELINLPKIEDYRGNLTFFEDENQIPFKIRRVFWTYDVPGGQQRGGHAYYTQNEFIIALSGSFDIVITLPNKKKKIYKMNRSFYGLFVPALTWRHLENFSTNALSLHTSDSSFDEKDYIREFDKYRKMYEK